MTFVVDTKSNSTENFWEEGQHFELNSNKLEFPHKGKSISKPLNLFIQTHILILIHPENPLHKLTNL